MSNFVSLIILVTFRDKNTQKRQETITPLNSARLPSARKKFLSEAAYRIGNQREGVLDEIVYPIKMLMNIVPKDYSISACVARQPPRIFFSLSLSLSTSKVEETLQHVCKLHKTIPIINMRNTLKY